MVYDFIIIGAGASGLQLALRFCEDDFLKEKTVLVLEKDISLNNNKTWCFWEEGKGNWGDIVSKQWNRTKVKFEDEVESDISPYAYKMIKSKVFNDYALKKLELNPNIKVCYRETVSKLNELKDMVEVYTSNNLYKATQVFDSRIPNQYFKDTKSLKLHQHFKGFTVQTHENVFDDSIFTLMDFSVKEKDTSSFMYVLPTSRNTALLEFTFFTPTVFDFNYFKKTEEYLWNNFSLKPIDYDISDSEEGVIPMTNYNFNKHSTKRILKIGLAGGWARPSTGYSFKNSERFIDEIVLLFKQGKPLDLMVSDKFTFYDSLFIERLINDNKKGDELFKVLYTKNDLSFILKFLDGKTSILNDLKIMSSFNPYPFVKLIFRKILR